MFTSFTDKLSIELKKELPGFSAQKSMAPLGRKPPSEYMQEGLPPRKSAVLILIYPQEKTGLPETVLMLRPDNEGGNHAGQISFPGGGIDDSDADLEQTALREAEEEIGVERRTVSVLGPLTPLYIPVSNFMVHPFVGITSSRPQFTIHPQEVQELITCSLHELTLEKNKGVVTRYIKIRNAEMEVPCYKAGDKIIWGATAMILAELEEILSRIR